MELFIIIWIICAALGAMVARDGKKGIGAALGFLLGPIGVVVAVLIK